MIRRWYRKCRDFYHQRSSRTQHLVRPFVFPLKVVRNIARELRFEVYEGTTLVYITSGGVNPYILLRSGETIDTMHLKNSVFAWKLKEYRATEKEVIINMHKLLTLFFRDGYLVPFMVRQVLYLTTKTKPRITKRDVKKIEKFQWEIATDTDSLHFFYEHMFVPHIQKRFSTLATVDSFALLNELFRKDGEVLFITAQGKRIAGALCSRGGATYYSRRVGVVEDSDIRDGALYATYYYTILRARELNATMVDFGLSRPFLSDGVLRHKAKWGTQILEDTTHPRMFYLKNILKEPFICIENKKLKAVVFSQEDKYIKEYADSGLEFKVLSVLPRLSNPSTRGGS